MSVSESRTGEPVHPAGRLGDLAGVIPILVTPFTPDGAVSREDLDRQLEFLIAAGGRWAGFGFGSEVHRLGEGELTALVTRAVATADGRLGIIGNAELRSVTGAIEQVRRVQATGAQIAADFHKANPLIPADGLTVACGRGELSEVRVCLTRELTPRSCGKGVRNSCPAVPVGIPAMRGQ